MSASIYDQNLKLARTINDEARNDPQSPYLGKFVLVADGQFVAVADDLDGSLLRLRDLGIDLNRAMIFEVGLDYEAVQEIWDIRQWRA